MSLYSEYIKESKGNTVVEDEMGFYEYSLKEECLYIENAYIIPERRGNNNGRKYMVQMAEIAKAFDLHQLMGVVNVKHLNANYLMDLYLKNGGNVILAQNDNIYFTISVKDALKLQDFNMTPEEANRKKQAEEERRLMERRKMRLQFEKEQAATE